MAFTWRVYESVHMYIYIYICSFRMVCAEVCAEVLFSCDFSIFLAPVAPCAVGIGMHCLKMSKCMSLTCMFLLIALPEGRARFGPHFGGPRGVQDGLGIVLCTSCAPDLRLRVPDLRFKGPDRKQQEKCTTAGPARVPAQKVTCARSAPVTFC